MHQDVHPVDIPHGDGVANSNMNDLDGAGRQAHALRLRVLVRHEPERDTVPLEHSLLQPN